MKLILSEEEILSYLDECIEFWTTKRDGFNNSTIIEYAKYIQAIHYIDAYKSVKASLFDEN